jgi:hypothetical protein
VKYKVIAFYPEGEDAFYLHEMDTNTKECIKDYEHEVIGYTDKELDEFTGL